MSACADCGRGLPSADDHCPACGAPAAGVAVEGDPTNSSVHHDAAHTTGHRDAMPKRAPWHFWAVVVAAAGYLAWRVVEGAAALISWLFT